MKDASRTPFPRLNRELGVWGATMMGLGAMTGTGVFVSIGLAAGVAGPSVIPAVVVAGLVAFSNALSSAQLAASHPVSGGTYEYGYKYLSPALGFSAGWMFLCAKSASAATAALGFGGYLLRSADLEKVPVTVVAVSAVTGVLLLVMSGMKRSGFVNTLMVLTTFTALIIFAAFTLPTAVRHAGENLWPVLPAGKEGRAGFLQACALMFVAYTGYGRVATMGEEVENPRRSIPRAIVTALTIAAVFYMIIAMTAAGVAGAASLGEITRAEGAPLESILQSLGHPRAAALVAAGAMTAMFGVLLNLMLGLSRVILAMGRRGDLPEVFAGLSSRNGVPVAAVALTGGVILCLCLTGNIKLTWSFSAFTVLVYYAVTNLAALKMPKSRRLYPAGIPVCGLASCVFLAFWVDREVWMTGLAVLLTGLGWHWFRRWRKGGSRGETGPGEIPATAPRLLRDTVSSSKVDHDGKPRQRLP